jgi:hypothetical protein
MPLSKMDLLPTDDMLNSPIDETFHDVDALINSVAGKFSRSRGVPFDDVLADAYEIFVVAWHNDRSTDNFEGWLWWKLNNGLRDKARREAIHKQREAVCGEEDVLITERDPSRVLYDRDTHLQSLSHEGRIAAVLALDYLNALHKSRVSQRKPTADRGDTLRRFLRHNLNWSATTVKRVWRELEVSIAPHTTVGQV